MQQNSIPNDADLHKIQESAYNNQLQLGAMPSLNLNLQPENLTLGPGLSYNICPTFG